MKVFRKKKCSNSTCCAFRTNGSTVFYEDISNLPLDTDEFSLLRIYRSNINELLEILNNGIFGTESMDTVCSYCRGITETSFYFPEGPPPLLFFALQGVGAVNADKDNTLLKNYSVQGIDYEVFAYSVHTGQHIFAVFYDESGKCVYDDLQDGFRSHTSSIPHPIVSIWLIRVD